jgi:hypothetical protein
MRVPCERSVQTATSKQPTAPPREMGLESSFAEVADLIQRARQQAIQSVNIALIDVYGQVGEYISRRLETAMRGEGGVEQLAAYIPRRHPDMMGSTRRTSFGCGSSSRRTEPRRKCQHC